MAKTKRDLIYRALRNLGTLPQGQVPDNETYQSMSDLVSGMVAELRERDVLFIESVENLKEEWLQPLGHILAMRAAPEFGAAQDQTLMAYAKQAEKDLRQMESARYTGQIATGQYF